MWLVKKLRHIIESSQVKIIIQTDHSAIIDILQQSSITSTTSTMRLNLRLVRVSQFLQQFRLDVRHKLRKEHIVPDALSRLASANSSPTDVRHSELDALFLYNTTLVKIHPMLVSQILASYDVDPWSACFRLQIQHNSNLGTDAVALLFVLGFAPPTEADSYMEPQPEGGDSPVINALSI